MKTIHHVIAAAVDAGMSEPEAEALAKDISASENPVAFLADRIKICEESLGELTKRVAVLREIRAKWGPQHDTETPYQNGHDERRMRGVGLS